MSDLKADIERAKFEISRLESKVTQLEEEKRRLIIARNEKGETIGKLKDLIRLQEVNITELERERDSLTNCLKGVVNDEFEIPKGAFQAVLFAETQLAQRDLEQQIEALKWCLTGCRHSFDSWAKVRSCDLGIAQGEIRERVEQLRKQQEDK